MTSKKTGGTAFPTQSRLGLNDASTWITEIPGQPGMTLRDYFAAKAMQGDIATYTGDLIYETPEWFEARALKWYDVADAMLKAREQ